MTFLCQDVSSGSSRASRAYKFVVVYMFFARDRQWGAKLKAVLPPRFRAIIRSMPFLPLVVT